MKRISFIFIIITIAFIFFSCNLNGPGIFTTIANSTSIDDSDLATEPVRNILKVIGNIMYIQHGLSVKKADINSTAPSWSAVEFDTGAGTASTQIFEAVVTDANALVYAAVGSEEDKKSIYTDSLTAPSYAVAISDNLENITLMDIKTDGTDVYVFAYDSTNDLVEIYSVNTVAYNSTLEGSFTVSHGIAPTVIHLVNTKLIFTFYDSVDEDYANYVIETTTLAPSMSPTEESNDAFKDDDGNYIAIIGAYYYNSTYYLVLNDGILLTTDDDFTTYEVINDGDGEYMGIVTNSSGGTTAEFSIPMTVAKDSDNKELLLMGGIDGIYYYDTEGGDGLLPAEFSTSSDEFYSNLSSIYILDFYSSAETDFSFYTATYEKWVWETDSRAELSEQLL